MRTTEVNVNEPREAYTAPQVEVIEMETEGSLMITSPGADHNGDPGVETRVRARRRAYGIK